MGKGARVKKKKKDCLKIISEFIVICHLHYNPEHDPKSFMTSQFSCVYVDTLFEGLDVTRSS